MDTKNGRTKKKFDKKLMRLHYFYKRNLNIHERKKPSRKTNKRKKNE